MARGALLLAAALALSVPSAAGAALPSWEEFKARFAGRRVFARGADGAGALADDDVDSEARRRASYEANLAFIVHRNAEQGSYRVGVNQYADLDLATFGELVLRPGLKDAIDAAEGGRWEGGGPVASPGAPPAGPKLGPVQGGSVSTTTVAAAWDWREHGAVTSIKKQGSCGSVSALLVRYARDSSSTRRDSSLTRCRLVVVCVVSNRAFVSWHAAPRVLALAQLVGWWSDPTLARAPRPQCWSFVAAANLEGSYAIATGALRNLSNQQLMDCSTEYPNSGCNGGAISTALDYIVANGGLNGEDDYPFTQADNEEVVFPCDTVRKERYVWLGEPEQDARD